MNPMSFRFPMLVCAASLLAGPAIAAAPAPQAWPAEPQFLPVTAQRIAALPAQGVLMSRRLMRGAPDEIIRRIDEEADAFKMRLKSPEAQAAFMAFMTRKK